jgi:N-methylhydantoinase A
MNLRMGCDVGGTFTDFLLHDLDTGAITTLKVPTTPDAPEDGVGGGARRTLICPTTPDIRSLMNC